MENILTFIIPVRHQDNAKDWKILKKNLTETINSITAQTHPQWKAVIVANNGADLPKLPNKFEVKYVNFPPNERHEQGKEDKEIFYEFFRFDKGRRVLAGMLHTKGAGHFMIVDDDDFVSCELTSFVAENKTENGWYIHNGYIWGDGGYLLSLCSGFSHFCGTSLIIRSDLYQLPNKFEKASKEYIKNKLGSHIFIQEYLKRTTTPLEPLPFPGAVYRIGHVGAHSKSKGLIAHYFMHRWLLKQPREFMRRLLRMRFLTRKIKKDFFGRFS